MYQHTPMYANKRIWAIAIAETIVWAGLFYIFPANLINWADHFNWGIAQISIALTCSLITSAISGIVSGIIIDRGYSKLLMVTSSFVGALLLLSINSITDLWQFYMIWILIGIMFSGCLYEPCFAFITRSYGQQSKQVIIMVTLVAGFAGTISFPITNLLTSIFNWQTSLLFFSMAIIFIASPLFLYGTSISTNNIRNTANDTKLSEIILTLLKSPFFWGLSLTLFFISTNHGMLISQILPLLKTKGLESNTTVLYASLIGPSQVFGRMTLFAIESYANKKIPAVVACFTAMVLLIIAVTILKISMGSMIMTGLFIFLQGGAYGIMNIVKPTIISELLGKSNYGLTASLVGVGWMLGFALAPAAGGIIATKWSYNTLTYSAMTLAVLGLITLIFTINLTKKR